MIKRIIIAAAVAAAGFGLYKLATWRGHVTDGKWRPGPIRVGNTLPDFDPHVRLVDGSTRAGKKAMADYAAKIAERAGREVWTWDPKGGMDLADWDRPIGRDFVPSEGPESGVRGPSPDFSKIFDGSPRRPAYGSPPSHDTRMGKSTGARTDELTEADVLRMELNRICSALMTTAHRYSRFATQNDRAADRKRPADPAGARRAHDLAIEFRSMATELRQIANGRQ